MRVGLLGGSFNPVHNAHLRIAAAAREACQLDRVIFIPAAEPPHKQLEGNVSFEHRAAMVALAIAEHPEFEMSAIEAERGGKSYSIDTIRAFRELFPTDELFFIIGGDSFVEIGSWHCHAEIFSSCNLIVVERPGSPVVTTPEALPEAVRNGFSSDAQTGCLTHESGHTVFFVTGSPLKLSSTEIRRRAATGADISRFLPPEVATYISRKRIYHPCQ